MAGYIGTGAVPQATQKRDSFTATAGQTSFPTSGYTPGFVDVYMNGVKLAPADFTATNSSDVVLAVAAVANDTLEIISYSTFDVSAQTFTGDVTASGGTFLPTGDTSAGDAAAMGYAAADGLVLTGQGSTSDVTIKNDADATVMSIPTGTTGVTFAGTPTFPDGSINIADLDIDGGTDIGAALVDADLMVVDDGAGGTNRKATMSRLSTYMGTKIGGGSLVFIASTGAISNAASVQFRAQDGHFDETKYDHYQFWLQNVIPATDAVYLLAQTSTNDGGAYASTNGDYHNTDGADDNIGIQLSNLRLGSATNEFGISGMFNLFSPHDDAAYTSGLGTTVAGASNGLYYARNVGGTRLAVEDVDALRFIMESGNIESGEIVMYGIKNS
tara:strand:+ start:2737 stop:3894 length:1158 start_codon:yes stop_codon:yes gene_type:complete